MNLKLHWFLPTSGDGRAIIGRGHSVPLGSDAHPVPHAAAGRRRPGQADEQRRFGDHLPHDERYQRTGEFLSIVRGAWSGVPYDFRGDYYQVEGATVLAPPEPPPDVYFGGSSPAAGPVADAGPAPELSRERLASDLEVCPKRRASGLPCHHRSAHWL